MTSKLHVQLNIFHSSWSTKRIETTQAFSQYMLGFQWSQTILFVVVIKNTNSMLGRSLEIGYTMGCCNSPIQIYDVATTRICAQLWLSFFNRVIVDLERNKKMVATKQPHLQFRRKDATMKLLMLEKKCMQGDIHTRRMMFVKKGWWWKFYDLVAAA